MEDVSYTDVEQWASVSADVEFQSTVVGDTIEDGLNDDSTTTFRDSGGAQESSVHDNDSDDDEEPVPCRPLAPLPEIFAKLNDLEKLVVDGCVTETHCVTSTSCGALLFSAKMEESRFSSLHLFITELLSKHDH